jgi:hypothetical protein
MSAARPPEGARPLRLRRGACGVPEKKLQLFLGVAGVAQHAVRSLGEDIQ